MDMDAETVLNNFLFYVEGRIDDIEKCDEILNKVGATLTETEQSKLYGRELELRELKKVVENSITKLKE